MLKDDVLVPIEVSKNFYATAQTTAFAFLGSQPNPQEFMTTLDNKIDNKIPLDLNESVLYTLLSVLSSVEDVAKSNPKKYLTENAVNIEPES